MTSPDSCTDRCWRSEPAFIAKFGCEPGPDDFVFFDPDTRRAGSWSGVRS